MQQIKCASCEYTKFFVNSIAETSMISCCECGASFIVGTPAQQVKEPEPLEEPKSEFTEDLKEIDVSDAQEQPEPKDEFPEQPKTIKAPKLEQPVPEKEVVVEKKPLIRKLSPEEKQKLLLEMEKGA